MPLANLGMGNAQTMDEFGKQWAQQNNVQGYATNTGGMDMVQGRPVNVQPTNPNQAAEIASAQGNINSGGMTEAQARAQFGGEAIDNALAKGIKFGATPNLGMGGPAAQQSNPYLDQMAQGITQQVTDNWNRNLAPSIRSGAMAAGGFGGSRHGVVEANALKDVNQGLSNSLANLYGSDWTNQQNRNLQQQSINNSYNLGMANNNLGYANLDSNNAQFGANYGLQSQNYQNQWANNNALTANQIAQTPLNYFNAFNNNANQIAGQGGSTSQTANGNPWMGAVAGMQMYNAYNK